MSTCAHCNGPITGGGHAGRRGAVYCCFGCLERGELACETGGCSTSGTDNGRLGGTGVRLGIGVLVVGQSMIFGLALNLHDDVPPAARELTQWCIFAGTVLVMLLLGGPLVRTAWTELRRGRLTIEALFLLTMGGALAASLQAHLTGRGKIYFEVVSVLLVVYTLGKLIGARSRAVALAVSRAWGDRLGRCRLVDVTGDTRTVPVADVRRGDLVSVHPGELIAVDGVVRDGVGFVSEAVVSGEPFAVVRRPGDRVLAGSASCDAAFRITATADGTDRQVDRLLAAVEAARESPLSLQARADQLGQWFLPLVVATALSTFAYWTLLTAAGWEAGLFNAMSVLLVACPCVIGLATPVVIWSALGRLAERGVIVRSGDLIERLAAVDRVMFDKTGTLTEDRFALVDIETTGAGADRATLLGWLSLVQAESPHPIAKPFADLPRPFAPGSEPRVTALTAVPGCGVLAELTEASGARQEIKIGTREFVPGIPNGGLTPPAPGARVVYVAVDGELAAVATVAERLRDSSSEALARFDALGLPVEVLTGDAIGRAERSGCRRRVAACCRTTSGPRWKRRRPPGRSRCTWGTGSTTRRPSRRRTGRGAGERHRPRGDRGRGHAVPRRPPRAPLGGRVEPRRGAGRAPEPAPRGVLQPGGHGARCQRRAAPGCGGGADGRVEPDASSFVHAGRRQSRATNHPGERGA
ncbi:heavy metal translocating P-type ATPase [Frigoriglobus tundricola]|uniref:P-type Zn(2+) transporter n=1 Tax=Frigoriglobus tundricola TaxID=2774151 RepID=A0A6M5YNI3_9BACT|nr:HAD-IC family P-type ATPase [Frigoriglobus tundricola]QJW94522.1 Copper-exporting P-type ATPase A [Frigoriglobus tundricola]